MVRVVILALTLVVFPVAQGAAASAPSLKGAVSNDYTITVTQNGKRVKTLRAGVYTLAVNDEGNTHNFHLVGPGVNKKTTIPFVGRVSWTIKVVHGLYRYRCDAHFNFMHGSFRVA